MLSFQILVGYCNHFHKTICGIMWGRLEQHEKSSDISNEPRAENGHRLFVRSASICYFNITLIFRRLLSHSILYAFFFRIHNLLAAVIVPWAANFNTYYAIKFICLTNGHAKAITLDKRTHLGGTFTTSLTYILTKLCWGAPNPLVSQPIHQKICDIIFLTFCRILMLNHCGSFCLPSKRFIFVDLAY